MKTIRKMLLGFDVMPEPLLWLQRRETWVGAVTANYIRMAALCLFTINEMINFHLLHIVDQKFHIGSLLVVMIWFIAAIDFQVMLRRHWMPRATPYLMTGVDLFLLTWLLFLADGPRSPLIVVYPLIIALAGLTLEPRVVLFSAGAAAFGYLSIWEFARRQKMDFIVPFYYVVLHALAFLVMALVVSHTLNRLFQLVAQAKERRAE